MISTTTLPKTGMKGRVVLFYGRNLQIRSWNMRQKLKTAAPVLYRYFFNLNEITIVKKENEIMVCEINFYQQLLTRVSLTKRKQFLWMKRYSKLVFGLPTEQSIKSFTLIFQGFCLIFEVFMADFLLGTTLGKHLMLAVSANIYYSIAIDC